MCCVKMKINFVDDYNGDYIRECRSIPLQYNADTDAPRLYEPVSLLFGLAGGGGT